jgi:hypothetical protein
MKRLSVIPFVPTGTVRAPARPVSATKNSLEFRGGPVYAEARGEANRSVEVPNLQASTLMLREFIADRRQ